MNYLDRILAAVERLVPVAETVVAETKTLGAVQVSCGMLALVLLIMFTCLSIRYDRQAKKDQNVSVVFFVGAVLSGFIAVACLCIGVHNLFAPTCQVLGL